MKLTKNNILNFNVDYLELCCTLKDYREVLKGVDSDNSNFRNYKGFTLEKSDKINNYQFKITFWKRNVPMFAWYKGDTLNSFFTTNDYLAVYGSTFTMLELNEIIDFIQDNFEYDNFKMEYKFGASKKERVRKKYNYTLKRVDLAVDIIKPTLEVVNNFKELKSKGAMFFGEKGGIQTYYIGEKKNTRNKNILVRVYDKIADIKHKEKQFLYPSYLKEKYVTRIEIEFRSEMLKTLKLEQLLDRSYIFSLFTTYISKHTTIFENISGEKVKLQRPNRSIKLENLHTNQIVSERYLNNFLGYAKKILLVGACPVNELLIQGIVKEMTLRDIKTGFDDDGFFDIEKYRNGVNEGFLGRLFADNLREDEQNGRND